MSYTDRDSSASVPYADGGWRDVLFHPELDYILECLSNCHRREILFLVKEGESNTLDELLGSEGQETELTEIELIHHHLPKLEGADYIEWDRQRGELSKGQQFDQVAPLLELVENHADEFPADWPTS